MKHIDFVGVMFFFMVMVLGILFGGDPDIADAIIHWIMKQ